MQLVKHDIDINRVLIERYMLKEQRHYVGHLSDYYTADDPPGIKQIGSAACILHEHIQAGRRMESLTATLRTLAPYTFTILEGGLILPLNREYKPLGQRIYNARTVYDEYTSQAIPANRLNLDWCYHIHDSTVGHCTHTLFNDSCPPWHSQKFALIYLERTKGILGMIEPVDLLCI